MNASFLISCPCGILLKVRNILVPHHCPKCKNLVQTIDGRSKVERASGDLLE